MSALVDIGSQFASIPRGILLTGHCLFVAASCRASRSSFLLNYWAGFFCAFGGGITSGLLLQDPQHVPISLFSVNSLFFIWTISWWIINYSPRDIGYRIFQRFIVRLPCKVCVNILRTATILSRADASVQRYPGNTAAPLVLGALGGCGGKFLLDALYISSGHSTGPSELISPAYSWRSASFTALIYSLAVHYYGFYTPKEGLAILTFLFVLHAFLGDVLKRPLDFTEPLARRFYSLANIPNPSSQTQKSGSNTKKTE